MRTTQKIKAWIMYPSRLGFAFLMFLVFAISLPVIANDVDRFSSVHTKKEVRELIDDENVLDRMESTMQWLLRDWPRHPINKYSTWRRRLASYILDAGKQYGEDPFLLLTIIYAESSFRPEVIGKIGERGLGQQHGLAARGCNLNTPKGQAYCTARWLSKARSKCNGSNYQAITKYAAGYYCRPVRGERVDRLVRYRLRLYRRILARKRG